MTDPHRQRSFRYRLARAWLITCSLVAAAFLLKPVAEAAFPQPAEARVPLTKNIEDIVPGDLVWAREEFGEKLAPKRVVQVFRNVSDHVRILNIQSPDGAVQEIKTTDGHPFWVEEKGWIHAGAIELGDRLSQGDHTPAVLISSSCEERPEGVRIFNFEVEGYHTYFVAEHRLAAHLLVHNASGPRPPPAGSQPWRFDGPGTVDTKAHGKYGPFHKHGSTGRWWARDRAGHGGSWFKVFKECSTGLDWVADADRFGNSFQASTRAPKACLFLGRTCTNDFLR